MDSDALVEEQIEDGRKLIGLLKLKGIDVTAAAWVKSGERDTWSLYIATEEVDKNGSLAAYHKILGVLRSMPGRTSPRPTYPSSESPTRSRRTSGESWASPRRASPSVIGVHSWAA